MFKTKSTKRFKTKQGKTITEDDVSTSVIPLTQQEISDEIESFSSNSECALPQGDEQFSIEEQKQTKQEYIDEQKQKEKDQQKIPKFSKSGNTIIKRTRSQSDVVEYKQQDNGSLISTNISKSDENNLIDKKKIKVVKEMDVSDLEGFWLTIEFCMEKDFLYCLSLLTVSRAKEMFSYFARICARKMPFAICSSGWVHGRSMDFISTNLDVIRSRGSTAEICIRLCTPSQSRLAAISLPTCCVTIKDYIQTSTGRFTTKPTYEDIKKEEERISENIKNDY